MFAVLMIMAVSTALAAIFAIVIHEMAVAKRQEYLEEASLDNFGFGHRAFRQRQAAPIPARVAATPVPRRQVVQSRLRRGHSSPILH